MIELNGSHPWPPLTPCNYHRALDPYLHSLTTLGSIIQKHLFLDTLPRIRIGRQRFVLHSWIYRRTKLRFFIIDHGYGLLEVVGTAIGDPYWVCGICDRQGKGQGPLFNIKATSVAISHFKNQYNVAKGVISDTSSSQASVALAALRSHAKTPRPTTKEAVERFKDDLTRWIVESNVPLNAGKPFLSKSLASPPVLCPLTTKKTLSI